MIKAGGDEMIKAIHQICKQVWQEGTVPEEWTKSLLITIPKKGDLTLCKNCRTIALINPMGKVLMIILLNRLKVKTEYSICRMNKQGLKKTEVQFNKS